MILHNGRDNANNHFTGIALAWFECVNHMIELTCAFFRIHIFRTPRWTIGYLPEEYIFGWILKQENTLFSFFLALLL